MGEDRASGGDGAPADGGGRDARNATGHPHPDLREERGEDPAPGTVDGPVAPSEARAGNLDEAAANLGGPGDVFPLRGRARTERPAG